MIHSMTGYGKAEGELSALKVTVQLKSLNSKQSDITIKLPSSFREKELEFRKLLSNKIGRGKIELFLTYEVQKESLNSRINEEVFNSYYHQLKSLSESLDAPKADLIATISKLPDVVGSEDVILIEEDWTKMNQLLTQAAEDLISFRKSEGESLHSDLSMHIQNIEYLLENALQFEEERSVIVKERLQKNLAEAGQKEKIDRDRFEQELIYYLEKLDISEEKVRLKTHCEYFKECMSGEAGQGKKLGFISQEIGREINTLGSKANHAEMQKLVVQMKDELEKIKEQVLNIW